VFIAAALVGFQLGVSVLRESTAMKVAKLILSAASDDDIQVPIQLIAGSPDTFSDSVAIFSGETEGVCVRDCSVDVGEEPVVCVCVCGGGGGGGRAE
jgi:hypothetical protein